MEILMQKSKLEGHLWKEDGTYTITASQGTASERTESIDR